MSSWNPFGFISDLFTKNKEGVERISTNRQKDDDWEILGLIKNKRATRFIPYESLQSKYLKSAKCYKVLVPRANGSGAFGEVFSTPVLGTPVLISTDTFLQMGQFKTETEAVACLRYVKNEIFPCYGRCKEDSRV